MALYKQTNQVKNYSSGCNIDITLHICTVIFHLSHVFKPTKMLIWRTYLSTMIQDFLAGASGH